MLKKQKTYSEIKVQANDTVGFFFFFAVLGFELGAYTLSHSTGLKGIFEIGSLGLFVQADFESRSS
jgi:hypothetical protein